MAKPLSDVELRRVYHHMFLPPQLPQQSDDTTDIATHFIRLTLDALRAHLNLLPTKSSSALRNAIIAIENLSVVNNLEHGATSESELLRTLVSLSDGHSARLFIRQQNAAVLALRQDDYLFFLKHSNFPLRTLQCYLSEADVSVAFRALPLQSTRSSGLVC